MRGKYRAILVAELLLGWAAVVQAQTPGDPPVGQAPAPAAAAPAPPAPGPLHQWGTDFSFMFDGYLETNFNNPSSGFNGLRAFDVRSDMPHVNMGMITRSEEHTSELQSLRHLVC